MAHSPTNAAATKAMGGPLYSGVRMTISSQPASGSHESVHASLTSSSEPTSTSCSSSVVAGSEPVRARTRPRPSRT
eukprot:scaffold13925_cov80-Phaeocystis_antarctica.AAC.2